MIFSSACIEFAVVNTYSLPIWYAGGDHHTFVVLDHRDFRLLWYNLYRAHPLAIRDWIDHPRIKELQNHFLRSLHHRRVQSSFHIPTRIAFILHKDLILTSGGAQSLDIRNRPTIAYLCSCNTLRSCSSSHSMK